MNIVRKLEKTLEDQPESGKSLEIAGKVALKIAKELEETKELESV